ncbi:retron system putative HNH endonuclease [Archangium violaceum]|uniref:retron system putative HNH endonuclease n=1 Tax=Archangium violaceum TaxID=83451 RepID=UPI002B305166|nr:retron system putative HNH endonuclease [Archangium gephyra]
MRYIHKGQEPEGLLEYRLTPHATYEGLPQEVKDELRERLAREQGFLCCYCMQRIKPEADGMKIEHWASQSAPSTRHRQLDWKNLLGACKGGEGSPQRQQHCDTRKGDTPIQVNPTDEGCERLVRFLADGTIASQDSAIDGDLNQTLNLNQARLKHNRRAILDGFLEAMRRKYPGTTWTEAAMARELEELMRLDASGRLGEYCQVPIFWLKKRMGRLGQPRP